MKAESICVIATLAILLVPATISAYKNGEYTLTGLFLIFLAVHLAILLLVFCFYGINSIKYVFGAENLCEIWWRLLEAGSSICGRNPEFKHYIKEYVMLYGC